MMQVQLLNAECSACWPLQEFIIKVHSRELDLEEVMTYMCVSRMDGHLVHLLRAITAEELWHKQEHYKTFIPGIDAYG